jgi:hypothetical protein
MGNVKWAGWLIAIGAFANDLLIGEATNYALGKIVETLPNNPYVGESLQVLIAYGTVSTALGIGGILLAFFGDKAS